MPEKITVTIDNDEIEYNGRKFRPVEGKKEKKWWRAKRGERFFFLAEGGERADSYSESNHDTDDALYASHNYWRTEKDALLYGEFVKATVEAMANVNGAYTIDSVGGTCSPAYIACTSPQFDTVGQAQAYADLRKRFAEMVRTYVE